MSTAPPAKQQAIDVKWYPVKAVVFVKPTPLSSGVTSQLQTSTTTQTNVPRWTIEHSPSWRIFKITFYSTNPKDEPTVRMLPESSVQVWEPGQ